MDTLIAITYLLTNKSTQRVQTPPQPLHCRSVVSERILYKLPYLLRPLQCRPLVSDNIS